MSSAFRSVLHFLHDIFGVYNSVTLITVTLSRVTQDKDICSETACFTVFNVDYLKFDGWTFECSPILIIFTFNTDVEASVKHLCAHFSVKHELL